MPIYRKVVERNMEHLPILSLAKSIIPIDYRD